MCVSTDDRGSYITCRDGGGGDSTDTSVAVAELSTHGCGFCSMCPEP